VVLAAHGGADMTKIDLVYGSLGAGTDPVRLAVDGVEAIRLAARFNMPFDIPGNDELSGVPAWKTSCRAADQRAPGSVLVRACDTQPSSAMVRTSSSTD